MSSLIAFIKKDAKEQIRSGKWMFLGILFVLFGIMNPAIAKLTPWLLEVMSESLAESGMTVTAVTVTAMDSWIQFFKNMPMALIAFVLLESGIFTKEYQTGTLVLSLTKGLQRYKVVISKSIILFAAWTVGYLLCFLITYGYNAYFWDNSVAQNLLFSVFCWYIFGLFTIGLMIVFSVVSTSNTTVLMGVGGVVLLSYLLGLLPKVSKYLPTFLADGNSLIFGLAEAKTYLFSLVLSVAFSILCFVFGILIFNKKCL